MQACRYRLSFDAQDARDFGADCFRNFVFAHFAKLGIRRAACKAREADRSFRCPPRKEPGIENRAENAQLFVARYQKTKSVGRLYHLIAAIACGYNRNWRVFDSRK